MNKKILFPVIALAVLSLGVLGASSAFAYGNGYSEDVVSKIAAKFNLNKDDVEKVFNEVREEHQVQMQAQFEERLNQAVKDGKLTEAQKNLILNKHKELQTEREKNREAWQNLAPDERKTQMEAKRTQLQTWAKENGIDETYFQMGKGPRGGGGRFDK